MKQWQDKLGSSALLPETSRCCDTTWKLDVNCQLEVILHLTNQHFIPINTKQLHLLAFGRFPFQVVKPEQLEKVTPAAYGWGWTDSGCWFPRLYSPLTANGLLLLSASSCTHDVNIANPPQLESVLFESLTVSSCLHSEELQASFTFLYRLSFFVYFETIKAENLITYMLHILCNRFSGSNEVKRKKNSIFYGKLEVCQNLFSWSWQDVYCTSNKLIT